MSEPITRRNLHHPLETLFAAVQVGQIEAIDAWLKAADLITQALNAAEEEGRESVLSGQQGDGVSLIAAERRKHLEKGYTPEHDAGHTDPEHFAGGELRQAAQAYLHWGHSSHGLPGEDLSKLRPPIGWPWAAEDWKPSPNNQVRDLVKAGSLIAAEIDRLRALLPGVDDGR